MQPARDRKKKDERGGREGEEKKKQIGGRRKSETGNSNGYVRVRSIMCDYGKR